MSASISCKELLDATPQFVREFGDKHPAQFFRIVEELADSFDPANVELYNGLMRAWDLEPRRSALQVPERIDTVYVLSRVTLGADIKITSVILDAMKRKFPEARIVFAANRKSGELFEADTRVVPLEVDYPRKGSVSERLAFGHNLRGRLQGERSIVVDPDTRMTQLGLVLICEPGNYFHFPSRQIGGTSLDNLTDLTNCWLKKIFGVEGQAYVAPPPVPVAAERPVVAVSLGVGENETKRLSGGFETHLIRTLGEKYRTVWIDRGVGGEEASRVKAVAEASGISERIRFWEGSFAGFVSIIAQSDSYVGYDSAGQHAAAAAGIPLISIFGGAPSEIFRARWAPEGLAPRRVINSDELTPVQVLKVLRQYT